MPDRAPRRWTVWVPLMLFGAIVAAALWGIRMPRDTLVHSALVGQPMPAIMLPAALPDRPGISAATVAPGRPRLINIFASWCIPCRAEAPQLQALRAAGVEIVGVALKDRPEDLKRFLAETGNPFAAIGGDATGSVQLALGSSGVPESYLIAADGTIIDQHIGEIRADDVASIAARLRSGR